MSCLIETETATPIVPPASAQQQPQMTFQAAPNVYSGQSVPQPVPAPDGHQPRLHNSLQPMRGPSPAGLMTPISMAGQQNIGPNGSLPQHMMQSNGPAGGQHIPTIGGSQNRMMPVGPRPVVVPHTSLMSLQPFGVNGGVVVATQNAPSPQPVPPPPSHHGFIPQDNMDQGYYLYISFDVDIISSLKLYQKLIRRWSEHFRYKND